MVLLCDPYGDSYGFAGRSRTAAVVGRCDDGGMTIAADYRARIVASSTDRVAWIRARSRGVTATDAAKLAGDAAVEQVVRGKVLGTGFTGNAFTDHGRAREPEIAKWVAREHGIVSSQDLFHAAGEPRHLATPDGVAELSGTLVLSEIKTTRKAWPSIPRAYLRQVWWQQYVLGAERTLVIWEQHVDFVPISSTPECRWVERDEDQIAMLVDRADRVLDRLRDFA